MGGNGSDGAPAGKLPGPRIAPSGAAERGSTMEELGSERQGEGEGGYVIVALPVAAGQWQRELTDAERDIAARILRGESNRDIAERRGTSVRTVANQIAGLYHKLGIASRAELAALAIRKDEAPHTDASAELAEEVFRGILNGEWAIADRYERDERRFVIAQRRRRGHGRALSEREREVLAIAVQGHSNKVIAYELGLTPSTVATHLRRIMAKLEIESRAELIQVLPYGAAVDAEEHEEGASACADSARPRSPSRCTANPTPIAR